LPHKDPQNMKVLITLHHSDVAPRFDLATEVIIATLGPDRSVSEQKNIVLPQASAETLCQLILGEAIQVVVCGGIEEEYYQYLTWKKIKVLDSVIASLEQVIHCLENGTLREGTVLMERARRGSDGD
jgi:predicted Fe-Mo cluster-binding NifX family protein